MENQSKANTNCRSESRVLLLLLPPLLHLMLVLVEMNGLLSWHLLGRRGWKKGTGNDNIKWTADSVQEE